MRRGDGRVSKREPAAKERSRSKYSLSRCNLVHARPQHDLPSSALSIWEVPGSSSLLARLQVTFCAGAEYPCRARWVDRDEADAFPAKRATGEQRSGQQPTARVLDFSSGPGSSRASDGASLAETPVLPTLREGGDGESDDRQESVGEREPDSDVSELLRGCAR